MPVQYGLGAASSLQGQAGSGAGTPGQLGVGVMKPLELNDDGPVKGSQDTFKETQPSATTVPTRFPGDEVRTCRLC